MIKVILADGSELVFVDRIHYTYKAAQSIFVITKYAGDLETIVAIFPREAVFAIIDGDENVEYTPPKRMKINNKKEN